MMETRVKPSLETSFKVAKVREIMTKVMQTVLADKTYSGTEAGKWTKEISDGINREIKALNMDEYKHVVQVMIGQQTGAGCKYISKALWDVVCDHEVSEQLVNSSLFCIVAVFGIYC